jgi:outer membrane protein assembly factor BamB
VVAIKAADGSENWSATVSGVIASPPAVGSDGSTYVATDGGHLIGFGPSGAMAFDVALHPGLASGPSVLASGNIAVGEIDAVRVVDAHGTQVFEHMRAGRVAGTRALANGDLLAWGDDGVLEELSPSGTAVFSFSTANKATIAVPPVQMSDGKVGVIDSSGMAYLVDGHGATIATKALGAEPLHEVVQGATGYVFAAQGSAVIAIDFELVR